MPYHDFEHAPSFEVLGHENQTQPVIFNSPHSGCHYPDRFIALSRLNRTSIRASEDMAVDRLFSHVPSLGAVLQKANFPRAYLDVNREPYELDAGMFSTPLPPYANTRSIRVNGGLGTIAKIVAENHNIYASKLDTDDALARIELIYRPYHDTLRHLLASTHTRFNKAFLIDCHSMPSQTRPSQTGTSQIGSGQAGSAKRSFYQKRRPDFILGDRYGTSCRNDVVDHAVKLLRGAGFVVTKNRPYAGGFITEHYGRPQRQLHALQIEINRSLYMDEDTLELHDGFPKLQAALAIFTENLLAHPAFAQEASVPAQNLAAE
ncbi:MAG: N-formylglutamate amidohydrolase [Hyphomicrobiales bacterium]|nr:MAG: N-formylglutamate amidohydrolase [Hyphomicrobiales bacterium]